MRYFDGDAIGFAVRIAEPIGGPRVGIRDGHATSHSWAGSDAPRSCG
jgi:hypothetical protein